MKHYRANKNILKWWNLNKHTFFIPFVNIFFFFFFFSLFFKKSLSAFGHFKTCTNGLVTNSFKNVWPVPSSLFIFFFPLLSFLAFKKKASGSFIKIQDLQIASCFEVNSFENVALCCSIPKKNFRGWGLERFGCRTEQCLIGFGKR